MLAALTYLSHTRVRNFGIETRVSHWLGITQLERKDLVPWRQVFDALNLTPWCLVPGAWICSIPNTPLTLHLHRPN
jgi:hypothetical protein